MDRENPSRDYKTKLHFLQQRAINRYIQKSFYKSIDKEKNESFIKLI